MVKVSSPFPVGVRVGVVEIHGAGQISTPSDGFGPVYRSQGQQLVANFYLAATLQVAFDIGYKGGLITKDKAVHRLAGGQAVDQGIRKQVWYRSRPALAFPAPGRDSCRWHTGHSSKDRPLD